MINIALFDVSFFIYRNMQVVDLAETRADSLNIQFQMEYQLSLIV